MNLQRHTRSFVLISAIVLATPVFAREKSDVVVMKNGDRLTCEVKGLDSGALYVSLDYVDGTISIEWSKIARLESKQLFIVKEENGSVHTGSLATADEPARSSATILVTEAPGKEVAIDAGRIVRMVETSERFWQRFNGAINLGVIFSKGNESTQFNFGSETEYLRERWRAQANFTSALSASSGATTSTRNQLALGTLRLLPWDNYFYAGLADFLQSTEQSITLQTMVGAGVGRYLKNTNNSRISLLGGLAWQNTSYNRAVVAADKQDLADVLIAMDVNFFRFSKTNLSVTSTLLPTISARDRGRVHFNTNVSYYVKLVRNLTWNFSFYGNWDSRPPSGISGSDYGTSSGLSWTYGYK